MVGEEFAGLRAFMREAVQAEGSWHFFMGGRGGSHAPCHLPARGTGPFQGGSG